MAEIFFGTPKGVEEGETFPNRASLITVGLHRHTIAGIDGNGTEGAAAIVLSGGYEDDIDLGDEIIYTGHGGNDPNTGKQIADQSWNDPGNAGLVMSMRRKLPVRVIRGFKHNSPLSPKSGYKYGGLFYVVDCYEQKGRSGNKICRFKLKKMKTENDSINQIKPGMLILLEPTGKEPKWFSLGVDAPTAQKISPDSKMAQSLLNRTTGDTIDFGNGFRVLEIRRYLS